MTNDNFWKWRKTVNKLVVKEQKTFYTISIHLCVKKDWTCHGPAHSEGGETSRTCEASIPQITNKHSCGFLRHTPIFFTFYEEIALNQTFLQKLTTIAPVSERECLLIYYQKIWLICLGYNRHFEALRVSALFVSNLRDGGCTGTALPSLPRPFFMNRDFGRDPFPVIHYKSTNPSIRSLPN